MSGKNGKKLLIAIAVGAVVVKAVRDVMKAKKQEKEIRSVLDDFYEEELNWWDREYEEGEDLQIWEPDSENRMARAMYKLAVETSKLSHVIAYSHGVDEEALKKLQAKCTDEVKRINGAVTFEDAYRFQNE